jgi:hypothetical protein
MELLEQYDNLSNDNKVNILGISLIDENAQQWECLNTPEYQNKVTRLMALMINEEWNPILNHGTLFLGIVDEPSITAVRYRKSSYGEIYDGYLLNGYWRCTDQPFPLDSIKDTLEVQIDSELDNFELAWLIVPMPEHQKIFSELCIQEILIDI